MMGMTYFALLAWLGLAQAVLGQAISSKTAGGLSSRTEPACAPVSGERIWGRDLAAAVPQLDSLPPDLPVSYAPMPGVRRNFFISELQEIANRHGILTKISAPVCFAWTVHPLGQTEILQALKKSLSGIDADLDITDQCHVPVPDGEVVFPITGLTAESSRPIYWNGYVRYAENKKFTTWVQVRITIHEQRVIATHALRAGETIGPADIKTVAYSGPLQSTSLIHKNEDAAGKCTVRPIAEGTFLADSMLAVPQDVERQQLVTVYIHCGTTMVETQGIAVEAGHRGDVIKIRNPKTGRLFLGQISGHGIVTVVPGGEAGLVGSDKSS